MVVLNYIYIHIKDRVFVKLSNCISKTVLIYALKVELNKIILVYILIMVSLYG